MEVKQTLELIGTEEVVSIIFSLIRSDKGLIDFDKIIPTPHDLMFTPHIAAIVAYQAGYDKPPENLTQQQILDFYRIRSNKQKYGFIDWREWRAQNWGQVENAHNIKRLSSSKIEFSTKNAPAMIIVTELSKTFPTVEFKFSYSNESFSFNGGFVTSIKRHYKPENKTK